MSALNVTQVMVEEHKLIKRMIAILIRKCDEAEFPGFSGWEFFPEAVDFIRNYADKFHHGKEEDVLFKELVANGMPVDNSPVGAMLATHDEGRNFVREMVEAFDAAKAGDAAARKKLIRAGRGYAMLLTNHIEIEDGVLYPLSERVLPEGRREAMAAAYEAQEAASPELAAKYLALVEKYEKA